MYFIMSVFFTLGVFLILTGFIGKVIKKIFVISVYRYFIIYWICTYITYSILLILNGYLPAISFELFFVVAAFIPVWLFLGKKIRFIILNVNCTTFFNTLENFCSEKKLKLLSPENKKNCMICFVDGSNLTFSMGICKDQLFTGLFKGGVNKAYLKEILTVIKGERDAYKPYTGFIMEAAGVLMAVIMLFAIFFFQGPVVNNPDSSLLIKSEGPFLPYEGFTSPFIDLKGTSYSVYYTTDGLIEQFDNDPFEKFWTHDVIILNGKRIKTDSRNIAFLSHLDYKQRFLFYPESAENYGFLFYKDSDLYLSFSGTVMGKAYDFFIDDIAIPIFSISGDSWIYINYDENDEPFVSVNNNRISPKIIISDWFVETSITEPYRYPNILPYGFTGNKEKFYFFYIEKISYQNQYNTYLNYNGNIYGPFYFKDIYFMPIKSFYTLQNSEEFVLSGNRDNDVYIITATDQYGPYQYVHEVTVTRDQTSWGAVVTENDFDFIVIGGKIIVGPYDDITTLVFDNITQTWDYTFKKEGKDYVSMNNQIYGPYDSIWLDNFIFNNWNLGGMHYSSYAHCFLSYKEFFIINSKIYGPYLEILTGFWNFSSLEVKDFSAGKQEIVFFDSSGTEYNAFDLYKKYNFVLPGDELDIELVPVSKGLSGIIIHDYVNDKDYLLLKDRLYGPYQNLYPGDFGTSLSMKTWWFKAETDEGVYAVINGDVYGPYVNCNFYVAADGEIFFGALDKGNVRIYQIE